MKLEASGCPDCANPERPIHYHETEHGYVTMVPSRSGAEWRTVTISCDCTAGSYGAVCKHIEAALEYRRESKSRSSREAAAKRKGAQDLASSLEAPFRIGEGEIPDPAPEPLYMGDWVKIGGRGTPRQITGFYNETLKYTRPYRRLRMALLSDGSRLEVGNLVKCDPPATASPKLKGGR